MERAASLVTAPQATSARRGKQGGFFVCLFAFPWTVKLWAVLKAGYKTWQTGSGFSPFSLPSPGGVGLVAPAVFQALPAGEWELGPRIASGVFFLVMLVGYNEKILQIPSEKSFLPFIITGLDKLS